MDLFSKESNPLQYYLAKYGVMDTIEMFGLEDVMAITYRKIDVEKIMIILFHQFIKIRN